MKSSWDGIPEAPERSGWHWVEDATGLRPLLWRGDDWADALDRREWEDGFAVSSPDDMLGARYFGPVAMPSEVMARFRRERGLDSPRSFWTGTGIQLGLR